MSALYAEIYEADLQGKIRNPEVSFALSTWEVLRKNEGPPAEDVFMNSRLGWLMPDVMILKKDEEGALTYVHYGDRIARVAGFDMTGKRVSDFRGATGEFYQSLYARSIAERRPFVSVHRLGHFSERPMWERVILPLVTQGEVSALFVVNRALELEKDFSLTRPRCRESGVFALQFDRDETGAVADIVIIGANKRALALTRRRLDEVFERSMQEVFPGVAANGLWADYLEVAATRDPKTRKLRYDADGVIGDFDVEITPFRDGVIIDFIDLAQSR
jgi:hypothetical protein